MVVLETYSNSEKAFKMKQVAQLFSSLQFLIIWPGEGEIVESIGEYRNGLSEKTWHMAVQFFLLT